MPLLRCGVAVADGAELAHAVTNAAISPKNIVLTSVPARNGRACDSCGSQVAAAVYRARPSNAPHVNKPLWIVLTVLWVLFGLGSVAFALTSFFMFDAPGSTDSPLTVMLFCLVLTSPLFWLAGAIAPWVFRRWWSRAGLLFVLPVVDGGAIVIALVLLQMFCGGSFACR
jgi:hypothetical protein